MMKFRLFRVHHAIRIRKLVFTNATVHHAIRFRKLIFTNAAVHHAIRIRKALRFYNYMFMPDVC